MNTVEHIVECYFRICRNCFTMHDVKVRAGNNRQFDLLAIEVTSGRQFHVESSVTHDLRWNPDVEALLKEFDRKFFGVPKKRDGSGTDHARGKSYWEEILATYREKGLSPSKIQRVYCCWTPPEGSSGQVLAYSRSRGVEPIEVLSFRDEVLPALEARVGKANYEDEALRTLSLFKQREAQMVGKIRKGARLGQLNHQGGE